MTLMVEMAGEPFETRAVHRLALAVTPIDAMTGLPVGTRVRVGREVRRSAARRRRGDVLDPLAGRLDIQFQPRGTSTSINRHRLELPLPPPGGAPVTEVVIRLDDPSRRYAPRRLRVPVWTRRSVEAVDANPQAVRVSAEQRTVKPTLWPGSAYEPPAGTTAVRGQVRRAGERVPWPRIRALGMANEILGTAHGDDRGEFLLVLSTTGTMPPPPPTRLPVWLVFLTLDPTAPDPNEQPLDDRDPLRELFIEDAVRRDPAAAPGDLDVRVLRGERIPDRYIPAPVADPAVSAEIGRLTTPDPFDLV